VEYYTMRNLIHLTVILILVSLFTHTVIAQERAISEEELKDKISAFWLGQLVGNFYGLPFELC
jgi:hypothetical protein